MAKLDNNQVINIAEQKKTNHISGTTLKTSIDISRNDQNNNITLTKNNNIGNSFVQKTKTLTAKLNWIHNSRGLK